MQFLTAVQDTKAQIARWPRLAPLWPDVEPQLGVRRAHVPAYPYSLAYVIHPEGIVIIAVVHQRRRPGYWLSRIR